MAAMVLSVFVVARVFCVVSRALLLNAFLGWPGYFVKRCYVVARAFWVVSKTLVCGCQNVAIR